MTMMTDYKATPEQWEVQEKFAPESEDACCLLELRSRIERLELGAGIHDAVIKTLKSPTLADLSPAAQAIWDAWESEWSKDSLCHDQRSIASVLRAVARFIWMDKPLGDTDADAGVAAAHQAIHERLLLIAAELEAL
jgi:hypothetical protein